MSVLKSALSFRWANALSELTGYLSAACLVLATGVMVQAVASRYFFGTPTIWQTEISVYLLMVVTFVGAAYGLKHHAHVGVDLLVERLPLKGQLAVRLVTSLLSLGLVLVVVWKAYDIWHEAWVGDFRTPTASRFPLDVVYLILPIGMVLVALQYCFFIVEAARGLLGRVAPEDAASTLSQHSATADEPHPTSGEDTTRAAGHPVGVPADDGGRARRDDGRTS